MHVTRFFAELRFSIRWASARPQPCYATAMSCDFLLQSQLAVDFSRRFESAQRNRLIGFGCEFVALPQVSDRFFDLIDETARRLGAAERRILTDSRPGWCARRPRCRRVSLG